MSQQLVKKKLTGGYENVMPKSWIEAIKDKNTGQTLVEILQGFNMYFLPYNGNTAVTRCLVPTSLRKKGLWITYVKYDGNVYTEWYAANEIDDKSWGDNSNWRVGNNTLVGDITISANGNWVINGTETEFKAVGEKGNTPLLRVSNNKLLVSYNLGVDYIDVTDNAVYTKFRVSGNKLQSSTDLGNTWTDVSDYIASQFRWLADSLANNIGRILISRDEGGTWTDLSNNFTNNLHISKYIGANESLPTSGIAEGTIYAKGPTYAVDDTNNDNPIYRLWVYAWKGNTLAWQDNGEFTSIAAGIVQETGDKENAVMSQKATTKKITELEREVIYDVSAHNDGAKFASLSELLLSGNLSTLIPIAIRCGGMSIRFVQSSDNKYVQFRYMGTDVTTTATFTNTDNWQGVDNEPTVGSNNLVMSGGIAYIEAYNYEKLHSYNHNDPANEKDGYYFDVNGTEVAFAGRKISGYIPCQGLDYLWQVNALAAGFYNIKKQWIASSFVNSFDNGKFAVPSGAYYVRVHGFANNDFGVYYKAESAVYGYGISETDVEQNDRIDNVEDDIDSIQALDLAWLESYNQANPADEKDDYYFDPGGYESAMADRKISGYVKCSGLSKLWLVGGLAAGFYNANKVWISGSYVNSFDNNGFSVPAGAAYVRIHGFSTSSFGIYYEECHEYIPFGNSNLTKTIGDIERKIETSGGGGSASVTGYDIESVAGMAINVGAGKINGVDSDAVQLTVTSPLSANKSITMTIPTSDTVITDGNGYPCPCEVLSVVKDGVTLVEGTDYTWNVRAAVLAWRKTTAIKSLTGSAITGATVNIRFDYSRIDRIVVNKNTGVISLVKGYEGSTTTYDNSTLALVTPVGSDEKVLYNVFVRWGATSVLLSDIRPVFDYNKFGYKDEEYALIDSLRKNKASEIYPFYTQVAMSNLRINTGNMPLNAQARTVRIGFIGDSRTDSEQPENIHDGVYYGYPFTFGRTISGILNLGTRTYMQGHINCQRVLRDSQGSNVDIEVINYGKGGNMIQEWMHSYYGYFDRPTAANDGLISLKSYNGQSNIHDLVFINVTNPVFSCLELIDSQCPAALYKNDYTDSSYSLLYDIATRSKADGGHYALELHPQSDYGNGTTEAQRKILLEDMNKVYKAMYQRLIDTLKEQNPNVQIVILFGLPDQIGVYADNPVHYETSSETNRLMFDIAKSNNLPFMNLSYLFFGCEKRLGIYPLLTEYPEGNIHPSPYLHYVIGNVLTEYISNEMI